VRASCWAWGFWSRVETRPSPIRMPALCRDARRLNEGADTGCVTYLTWANVWTVQR
jgi:hypothetical protein